MSKCKYCKSYKVNNVRSTECSNDECEYYQENCVEKDRKEPIKCEYKIEKDSES